MLRDATVVIKQKGSNSRLHVMFVNTIKLNGKFYKYCEHSHIKY